MSDTVTLKLSGDEALVLLEWLAKEDAQRNRAPIDEPLERVFWTLEAQLEQMLVAVFAPDYAEQLDAARKRILAARG